MIDDADWGCTGSTDDDETDPVTQCNNTLDDDSDGKVDYPMDPGCDSPVDTDEYNMPACSDGFDNDLDGRMDFPYDAGCLAADDDDESDDDCGTAAPVNCPACGNSMDDDGDGKVDYPTDPGCDFAADNDEYNVEVGPCGPGLVINDLTVTHEATGTISMAAPNELQSDVCHGFGSEYAYRYHLADGPKALIVSTDYPETTLDTVVYLRSECRRADTELGCDDDGGQGNSSLLIVPYAENGDYYVIVDSYGPGSLGDFKVTIEERAGLHSPCDPADPSACIPGLLCRPLTTGAPNTCEFHVCGDSMDNDSDGHIDFPLDPGCDTIGDDTEEDACPAGPSCPQCGNNIDDDADGLIDYPADTGCDYAADGVELNECVPGEPVAPHPGGTVTGTTTGGPNLLAAPTGCDSGGSSSTAPERVYAFNLTQVLTDLRVSTAGSTYDTVLYVRYGTCSAPGPVSYCNNDSGGTTSQVNISSPSLGQYFMIVDGNWSASGSFNLSVTGTIAVGQPCTAGDPNFVCEVGSACVAGSCVPAACNNGLDDDGDTHIDFPNDPGCSSISDPDETDDCPSGPMCPQCGNGIDDDADGMIDYPADNSCSSANDTDESCSSIGIDTFGYQGCQDTVAAVPQCEDIHTTGTAGCGSDDCSSTVTLPFTFDFYGAPYTTVGFGSNGKLIFPGPGSTVYSNTCTIENNTIAVYWDDLNASIGGSMRYQTFGTAPNRHVTFQWNIPHYGGTSAELYDFRAVLYEGSNDIDVCYIDTTGGVTSDNGISATTGIHGATVTDGINYSCNAATVTPSLMLRYQHP